MANFKLEIITPIGKKFSQEIEFVKVRTTEGDMGILSNHAPFVSGLQPEEISIRVTKGKEIKYYISNGFIEVSNNNVTIIVDEALLPEEIDIEMAKKEVQLAQEKLKKVNEDKQIMIVQKTLQDALMKVKIAEKLL
ncbi:ATP synthase F1 subunit epsilon [Fusobacterium perfoetens]|uniref:ATP synthase F1 subunit epsilon n=1 Tax=Fusobacterium perfoetens TaxID=852 RepID=UPI000488C64A|nr:ATP synthase F1 subunit epsilon [Fusobacterium perfoetens]MCI6151744.1 ATP synthase F1 subunit epsilon [Fusobacterium perfoetens]MDY3237860.1 ATP synthase F1 subunit epsilon [Fusobacterium perfoetens]